MNWFKDLKLQGKIRPGLAVLLVASLLVLLGRFSFTFVQWGAIAAIQKYSPTDLILVGHPMACEMALEKSKTFDPAQRNQLYQELKRLLALSPEEFESRVKTPNFMKKLFWFTQSFTDEPLDLKSSWTAGSCLTRHLELFPDQAGDILQVYFQSRPTMNQRSTSFFEFSLFLTSQCQKSKSCSMALKDLLLKAPNAREKFYFLGLLQQSGPEGRSQIIQLVKELPETSFPPQGSTEDQAFLNQMVAILSNSPLADRTSAQQELEKIAQDPNTSPLRKKYLAELPFLRKGSIPSGIDQILPEVKPEDVILEGEKLLETYNKRNPDSMKSFNDWLGKLRAINHNQKPSPQDPRILRLTKLVNNWILWFVQHVGPQSQSLQQLLFQLPRHEWIQNPLTSADSFLQRNETSSLGLQLLALHPPSLAGRTKQIQALFKDPKNPNRSTYLQQLLSAWNTTEPSPLGPMVFSLVPSLNLEELNQVATHLGNSDASVLQLRELLKKQIGKERTRYLYLLHSISPTSENSTELFGLLPAFYQCGDHETERLALSLHFQNPKTTDPFPFLVALFSCPPTPENLPSYSWVNEALKEKDRPKMKKRILAAKKWSKEALAFIEEYFSAPERAFEANPEVIDSY